MKRWEDRWSFIAMIFVLCLFVVVLVNSVLRQAAETLVGATTEPRTTEGP